MAAPGIYAQPAQKVASDASEPGPAPSAEPAALSAGKDV